MNEEVTKALNILIDYSMEHRKESIGVESECFGYTFKLELKRELNGL